MSAVPAPASAPAPAPALALHFVRAAEPADADQIQTIFEQALRQADWLAPGADIDTDFKRNSSGEVVYVCLSSAGQVSGFLAVYATGAFIHHLYVAQDAQRQGVGRALLAALAEVLPKPWRLKCVVANQAARQFYARTGWVETEKALGSQGEYVVLRQF